MKSTLNKTQINRLKALNSRWKSTLYFIKKLPSIWWWGIKIKNIDARSAEIFLPFSWRTQNPFRSIYFAAQAGAAELSTGLLAAVAISGKGRISMLVVDFNMKFVKKATEHTIFICDDGALLFQAVEKAIQSKEAQIISIKSTGKLMDGTVVSEATLTWSLKCKD